MERCRKGRYRIDAQDDITQVQMIPARFNDRLPATQMEPLAMPVASIKWRGAQSFLLPRTYDAKFARGVMKAEQVQV